MTMSVDLIKLNEMSVTERRSELDMLHRSMRSLIAKSDVPNIATEHERLYADGVYVAIWKAPAGSLTEGSLHKYSHLSVLLKGRVQEATPEHGVRELTEGHYEVAPAGMKRTVLCLEDCEWLMVHPTSEKDPEKVFNQFIAEGYDAYDQFRLENKDGLGSSGSRCDRCGHASGSATTSTEKSGEGQ